MPVWGQDARPRVSKWTVSDYNRLIEVWGWGQPNEPGAPRFRECPKCGQRVVIRSQATDGQQYAIEARHVKPACEGWASVRLASLLEAGELWL